MLSELDRPLLCTSAHVEELEQLEIPEAAMFVDQYAGQGLDFIVDTGQRVCMHSLACCIQCTLLWLYPCSIAIIATDLLFGFMQGKSKSSSEMMLFTLWLLQIAEGSTVIDMTGPEPSLVRSGKGDPSLFVQQPALA